LNKTRVAVLGTLADLHRESIHYDLRCLEHLVEKIEPDLLCADIRHDHWENGDLGEASVEYREALVPLAERTNIVIVPVSGPTQCDLITPREGPLLGLRSFAVWVMNAWLRTMQRIASTPEAINSGVFGLLCDAMCTIIAWLCGPTTQMMWDEANQQLVNNILAAMQRDPGTRILVTVDCRRRHRLQQRLRQMPEIELVDFWKL
jgi:hypothetical protein